MALFSFILLVYDPLAEFDNPRFVFTETSSDFLSLDNGVVDGGETVDLITFKELLVEIDLAVGRFLVDDATVILEDIGNAVVLIGDEIGRVL